MIELQINKWLFMLPRFSNYCVANRLIDGWVFRMKNYYEVYRGWLLFCINIFKYATREANETDVVTQRNEHKIYDSLNWTYNGNLYTEKNNRLNLKWLF